MKINEYFKVFIFENGSFRETLYNTENRIARLCKSKKFDKIELDMNIPGTLLINEKQIENKIIIGKFIDDLDNNEEVIDLIFLTSMDVLFKSITNNFEISLVNIKQNEIFQEIFPISEKSLEKIIRSTVLEMYYIIKKNTNKNVIIIEQYF